jgi:hypothetical protein
MGEVWTELELAIGDAKSFISYMLQTLVLRTVFFFGGAGRDFIFVVIEVFGFQLLLDAGGIDDDRRFAVDRAFVLADAAARAFFFFNDGALLIVTDDGMIGTLLVANKADFFRVPSNTPCLVDMGNPHLEEAFFLDGERPDGFGGTDPSTKVAELFTVPDSGNEPRCVKAGQARLQKSRLKGIVRTDLQTFATARTHGDKFLFRKRPRRPNQPVILQSAL